MKNFVTKIIALAFLISIGSSAFAQYKGDIQLVLGHDQQHLSLNDGDIAWKSNSFDIGLKSFNTFDVVSFLGVGFLASCDLAVGKKIETRNSATPDMDFLIGFDAFLGPALTIKIMDIIALQGSIGFDWHYMAISGEQNFATVLGIKDDFNIYEKSTGFGFDVQAKLFPSAPLSAVFGLKSIFCGNDHYKVEIGDDTSTIDRDIDLNSFKFYAGGSLNF